jgi:transketolase
MYISPNKLKSKVLDMVYQKKSGHIGGSFSIAELVSVLFSDYDMCGKDKLILSKGHAVPIIYAALHEVGKISDRDLASFREINSPLQGHPDKVRLPLMDATTGSLGQGLSIAIGHALGKHLRKEDGIVFCVLGDGEMQEGQIWEALMYFPKLNLKNLICIVDWNRAQSEGKVKDVLNIYDNLQEKICSFGWDCRLKYGHNMNTIKKELKNITDKPLCLILKTIKGNGVYFMENPEWHSKVPSKEEYLMAHKILERKMKYEGLIMGHEGLISYLISTYDFKSYLEIGVAEGYNFERIECDCKVGVDPSNRYPGINYNLKSDDFFKINSQYFDIVFIDGKHEEQQVIRDVQNSLKFLNPNGIIVCHDIDPSMDLPSDDLDSSSGSCWRAWLDLRATRSDLEMRVVEKFCGCGIIRKGSQKPIDVNGSTVEWKKFQENKSKWLNLISLEEFLQIYK